MQSDPAVDSGLAQRIRDTFASPTRLVQRIRVGRPWLDVLLLSTAVALLSIAFMPDEVFTEPMRAAVSRRGEPVQITSAPDVIAWWGRGIGMLGTIATHPMIAFTIAGVLTMVFSILGRGKGEFLEYLSIVAHAMLIPALGTLVALTIRLISGAGTGSLGIAAFYDPAQATSLTMAAIVSIDPFIVWMLVVIGIGIHGLDSRRSSLRISSVLIGAYLLLVLASAAWLHPELRAEAPESTVDRLA